MRIVAICNQKGGVGKTTTTVNLGTALAGMGKKILLIDMDPQGNAGSGLAVNRYHVEKSIYHAVVGEVPLQSVIRKTDIENLFIAPSNSDLIGAELELVSAFARETKLKNAIKDVVADYDMILIDCPPSLNLLTVNALTAADSVIIPVQCEFYALEGIAQLMNTVELIQRSLNPDLKIGGIVMTMFDTRNNLSRQVVDEVRTHFNEKVFTTVIPRSVKLSESPSHGMPIQLYDSRSRGAESYRLLAQEVVYRSGLVQKGGLVLLHNEIG